ncbi:MAG TPA: hypothetical protein VHK66_04100 [Microvirga sp.]|jgi:hypothetical protein|nr:hypothetical protein [Microvirga sp.]
MSRASSFVLLAGWLVGCSLYPVPVRGVPTDAPWFALPLGEWLGEDRAEPEAVAACRPPECRPGLVVSVVRITGPDAVVAAGILSDPRPLARALQEPQSGEPSRTAVALEPLAEGAASGFVIALARRDGGRRAAYGAALGRPAGDGLRLVLAIGEDPRAVEEAARRVARQHLGA